MSTKIKDIAKTMITKEEIGNEKNWKQVHAYKRCFWAWVGKPIKKYIPKKYKEIPIDLFSRAISGKGLTTAEIKRLFFNPSHWMEIIDEFDGKKYLVWTGQIIPPYEMKKWFNSKLKS